jgi:hypothetical protein
VTRPHLLSCLAACTLLGACTPGIKGHLGYTQLQFGGDIALASGGGPATRQGVDDALGLGDESGSAYGRVEVDLGVPVVSASGLLFHDSGQGRLLAQFGTITVGTDVASEMDFANLKMALAFDVDLGLIKLAPGVALDVFDFDLTVRDRLGLATENIDVLAPVPMVFLRGQLELGDLTAVAEVGYFSLDSGDIDGRFLDAEAWLEARPLPLPQLYLFAGYRFIGIAGDGVTSGQAFDVDLDIRGWQVGGGIRF